MVELSYFALFLLFGGCLSAGIVAGVVHTWHLRASLYDVESRLCVVEGNLQREVKARAGQERWKKPDKDMELLKASVLGQPASSRKLNWWEKA